MLITFVAFYLHIGFIATSFIFLLFLIVLSLSGDLISSVLVSFLSVGCLDYFFVEPLFSFRVSSPLDTVGLASFLVIGLIIARLVIQVRNRNEFSRRQQGKMKCLYAFAQQLLSSELDLKDGKEFVKPFCGVFGIKAVCFFDAANAELHIVGNASDQLEKRTGEAFIHGDCQDSSKRIVARCIHAGNRAIGAIGFEGLADPDEMAGPLMALTAAHLERRRSLIHSSQAAAAAQTESYRTAILDALAHEFKTPLSTILTAAGALREAPSLGPQHREMTEIVESEAARLSRLTSRLIRTARLEREEVRPWIELVDVSSVVTNIVDQYVRLLAGRRIFVLKDCASSEAMADPELLRFAVSQLLDNACKYSIPGSPITLRIAREQDEVVVRILSSGNPIPLEEREKIFERFYRGVDGRRSGPGSGLGLFVARKIALALGGNVTFDAENPGAVNGTVFRLALPAPEAEHSDVATTV